jgi:cytoskeleton protein RodZ
MVMTLEPDAQFAHSLQIDSPDALRDGPGRQLRHARQLRNLTLEQVALGLRLSTATVTALEDDDYSQLPSAVFVAGYISSYARFLGQDPQPLVDRYQSLRTGTDTNDTHVQTAQFNLRQFVGYGVLLVLIILVLGGAWWFLVPHASVDQSIDPHQINVNDANRTSPPSTYQPASSYSVPATEASIIAAVVDADLDSVASDVSDERAPLASTPSNRDQSASSVVTSPPIPVLDTADDRTPLEVVMNFTGPCWVDIRDASGLFKLFGEMKQGDRHRLEGQPPYSVILGNASAVMIQISGQPFNIQAIAQGNVARFDLDPYSININ